VKRWIRELVLVPLKLYQRFVSPALPRRCKYEPTCSAYAIEAVRELGVIRGSVLAAWRLARCNPFSHGGYDPVEAQTVFRRPETAPTPPREGSPTPTPSEHRGSPA
jgi:putative membrane protein insertion efficiency factor